MPLVDLPLRPGYPSVSLFAKLSTPNDRAAAAIDPAYDTILLVHPVWLDGFFFYPQFDDPLFHARYNLVAFDLPGHGQTTVSAPWPEPYTFLAQADVLAAGLRALGLDRAHVLAVGDASYCGVSIAARHPGLVKSVACVAPRFVEWAEFTEGYIECRDTMIHAVRKEDADELDSLTTALFAHGVGPALSSTFADLKEEYTALARRRYVLPKMPIEDAANYVWNPVVAFAGCTEAATGAIAAPTLFLHHAAESPQPDSAATSAWAPLKRIVIEDGPNWPTLTSPDAIHPILASFFAAPSAVCETAEDGPLTPPLSARRPSTPRDLTQFVIASPRKLPPGTMTVGDVMDAAQCQFDAAAPVKGAVTIEVEVVTDVVL